MESKSGPLIARVLFRIAAAILLVGTGAAAGFRIRGALALNLPR